MTSSPYRLPTSFGYRTQRGVATLLVTLSILVILTIIVLSSSNVALFEQKTSTNENRARLAEQAAEYALNLGGEYLKVNVSKISSTAANGWLDTATATNKRWVTCAGVTATTHPCFAERDSGRRSQLYYYTTDGVAAPNGTEATLDLPYNTGVGTAQLTSVGGTAAFPVTAKVHALLCRLDTTAGETPTCQTEPVSGNRIAVTLVSEAKMDAENSSATVKETWATFNAYTATSAAPLVAAGVVSGLGNATIVAAPNAGGYGLPASVWSPRDVDVDASGAGIGSISTCHLGEYLGTVPAANLKTTCAGSGSTGCGCPAVSASGSDFLSGHSMSARRENVDILDVDGQPNGQPLPDIQFFPGKNALNVCMDDPAVATDDNLFEWIFGVDVNAASTCATVANATTENTYLDGLGANVIADCSSLNSSSNGLYRVTGSCSLPSQVGSATNSVVLLVNNSVTVGSNTVFFGMLFVRSVTNTATLTGNGNPKIFGSLVVEGTVNLNGNLDLIYVDTSAGLPGDPLPDNTRFARLAGSWLDNAKGF